MTRLDVENSMSAWRCCDAATLRSSDPFSSLLAFPRHGLTVACDFLTQSFLAL